MKKFINDPFKVTDELVEGFVLANQEYYYKLDDMNVVLRKRLEDEKKVALVIGGGSGHEPLFLEFIGKGMGDCAVHGNIFASPSADIIYEGIKEADQGEGVILIYGNYQGDIINFDMAQEMARMDDIRVETVRIWDDIASAGPENKEERRGTSGDIFVIKIAGAAKELGWSFDEVLRVALKARDSCRSLGIALSSCTLPAVGKPIFEIADDEMCIGMGVHGEPGLRWEKLMTADDTAKMILDEIQKDDLNLQSGDEISLIVNSYGATTRMELLIMIRRFYQLFEELGIKIHAVEYGDLCTSQEMAGVSVTIMKLDEELRMLYDEDAVSPGFTRVTQKERS
ncbi:dihydroxyacetone kinase subunit DhaK [Anaerolentibacter hominis]|uniref:dihydroxyacetone kinase subunit DhaK n=1 Tax=Anaerolentibacter hominis TaxID=3079009 RepID=UPI0031B7FF14